MNSPETLVAPPPTPLGEPSREARRRLGVFGAGVRLALLGKPDLAGLRFTPGQFWIAAAASLLLSCGLAYLAIDPPRVFERAGFETAGFHLLMTVLVCYLLARAAERMELLWPLAILLTVSGLVTGPVASLALEHALPAWSPVEPRLYWAALALLLLWWAGIVQHALAGLAPERSSLWQQRMSVCAVALLALPSFLIEPTRFWARDYEEQYRAEEAAGPDPLIAEEVFGRQDALLEQALARIPAGSPGRTELFFVVFAPYGEQGVFLREARYATRLFETRLGAGSRTLLLANSREQVRQAPMATATNLAQALKAIGQRMNADEDILFLFLTSHGSRDAQLSVELEDLTFLPVGSAELARMLRASGIGWKVLVVSGCYSGSFMPELRDPHTLLITAARADRSSFGCSDTADFTYFGRAYFEQALAQTTSFTEAFAQAKDLVAQWEKEQNYTPSEPQIATGPEIEARLERWRRTLEPAQATPR